MRTIHDVFQQVRAEFVEMPGLKLKPEQVQRLCGIERSMCQMILDALVDENFLRLKPDGHYVRVTEGYDVSRPPKAKSDLRRDRQMHKVS